MPERWFFVHSEDNQSNLLRRLEPTVFLKAHCRRELLLDTTVPEARLHERCASVPVWCACRMDKVSFSVNHAVNCEPLCICPIGRVGMGSDCPQVSVNTLVM